MVRMPLFNATTRGFVIAATARNDQRLSHIQGPVEARCTEAAKGFQRNSPDWVIGRLCDGNQRGDDGARYVHGTHVNHTIHGPEGLNALRRVLFLSFQRSG